LTLQHPQPATVAETEAQERKLVSIFFADIVESTAIVEDLDPEDALDQLNPAIKVMRAAVKRFGGTLCREQGDGVMAFFGAPRADDHHAVNACFAGLELVRAVEHLTHREMKARVGIHSGEVVVRLIEGEFGPSYDASGASVYLANRLESLARAGTVMVSAATLTLAAPYFDFVSEPPVVPKGFTQPVPVFSISGQRSTSRWMARRGKGYHRSSAARPNFNACRPFPAMSSTARARSRSSLAMLAAANHVWLMNSSRGSPSMAGRSSRRRPNPQARRRPMACSSAWRCPGSAVANLTVTRRSAPLWNSV
jgi:class 3 adenylate cyclase